MQKIAPFFIILMLAGCRKSTPAGIFVTDAWTREMPAATPTTAFYMRIKNNGAADRLVRVDVINCDSTELHQSTLDANGVARMEELANGVEIPAQLETVLQEGGLHVMCMQPLEPLLLADEVPIRLIFEQAGAIEVTAKVR